MKYVIPGCLSAALVVFAVGCGVDLSAFNQPQQQQAPPATAENQPVAPGATPVSAPVTVAPNAGAAPALASVNNQSIANDSAADLYAPAGKEKLLAATAAPADAPLRPRKDDSLFELSSPRVGTGTFGRPQLSVFYNRTKTGQHNGMVLVIRTPDGEEETVNLLNVWNDDRGEIEVEDSFPTPFNNSGFPPNMELYLARYESRYGPAMQRTFKVSNSVVVGTMPQLTLARNWTAEEADTFRKPFPNYISADLYPNIGRNTEFAGDTTGGFPRRHLDPEKHLLGVEYRLGAWDNEPCLAQLVCVFDRDQPTTLPDRLMAKEGYAVGGVNVQSIRYVNAVQLVYMKLLPDGRLDAADSYTSDWFGHPGNGTESTLAADGRKVIGIVSQQGAILNGVALVTAE